MKSNKDSLMPASNEGLNKIELHPITLSFQGALEKDFLENYFVNSLRMVRLSLLAGIVLYGLFGILDAILIPEIKNKLWIIRFAVVCPFMMGMIVFSYFPVFKRYFQPAMALTMIASGGGIIYMIAILPAPINQMYYAGLILVFIWGYTFTRVRFVAASTAGWILVALYEVVATKRTRVKV